MLCWFKHHEVWDCGKYITMLYIYIQSLFRQFHMFTVRLTVVHIRSTLILRFRCMKVKDTVCAVKKEYQKTVAAIITTITGHSSMLWSLSGFFFFFFYQSLCHGDCRAVIQRSGLSGRGQILLMCYIMGTYTNLVTVIVSQPSFFPDVFMCEIFIVHVNENVYKHIKKT